MSELARQLHRLEETVRNLLQPKSKAKTIASGGGRRRYFVLLEDAAGEYGPAWARITDRTGSDQGQVVQLYWWDGLLAGARAGYKSTCQNVGSEVTFEPGRCITPCESDGEIEVGTAPDGTVAVAYTHSVTATDIDSGSLAATGLPDGLTMNTSGAISGTPTAAGLFYAQVTGTSDKTGPGNPIAGSKCTVTKVLRIRIEEE